ncbi:MAG: GTPase [Terrisporobacter sp.]
MNNSNVAKVLILGRTGVGKSSFINYLLDNKSAKVGVGEPITQEMFTTYE